MGMGYNYNQGNMKKIQMTQKNLLRAFFGLFILTAACVFVSGCDFFKYKQPYDDKYYDSNFIANIGFDKFVGASTTVASPASTGQWDFAYRYESNWATNHYAYMALASTGDLAITYGSASGLSSNAPVYRLEVANLIAGGDFETAPPAGETWILNGSGPPSSSRDANATLYGSYNRNLTTTANDDTITYTPALNGVPDLSGSFRLFFVYTSASYFKNTVDVTPSSYETDLVPATKAVVSQTFAGNGSVPLFVFAKNGANPAISVRVDNFSLIRSGNLELRLLLRPQETYPRLEAGVYAFSVWVHTDTAASAVPIDTFTVNMRPTSTSSLFASAGTYAQTSGWVQVRATLSGNALQFSDQLTPVLELVLGCTTSRPGSVLLAQPTLTFYPDGL